MAFRVARKCDSPLNMSEIGGHAAESRSARKGKMGRGAVAVLSGLSAVVLSVAVFVVIHAGHLERVLTWGVVKRELAARHMTVSLGAGRLGLSGLELSDVTIAITKARKNAPVTSIHLASLRIDAS